MPRWNQPRSAGGWLTVVLGVVLLLIGVVLTIGGVQLAALGGSWYYLIAGIALVVSGVMIVLRDVRGAWLYAATFVGTLIWALWEKGLDGWALVPRLIGPLVLMFLVIAALPALKGRGGRRLAGVSALALVAATVVLGVVVAQANRAHIDSPVPGAQLSYDDPAMMRTGADWPAWGGTDSSQRYTPLTQINRDNVGGLERAWTFRTGDLPEERWGAETTPLKIGDTVYLCSARNKLFALDAATGQQRWTYDPQVADDQIPYTAACRGVTYHARANANPAEPCATRIVEGTLDGRLIAVDARTGRPCPAFGQNGAVSIKVGMGDPFPGMVSITSPPVIVRGVIVTGHQVLDGQKRWNASGVIQGFDVETGALRFAWDMMRPDITTLPPQGQTYTPGTPNMWTTATGDERLGLVYLPMGNSAADYYSSLRRPLEKQYSTALVALDVQTGRPRWRFQTVHNDVWDYDLGSQGTLIDFPTAGGVVPAVLLPSKQGDMYVLNRATGQLLHGIEERQVPVSGGVEPGQRARTQPFSLFATLRKPNLTERDMWGMSPIDQMMCRINFKKADYQGYYTPPSTNHYITYPGYNGGSDWGGVSVDPRRGVIVANYNDMPNYNRLVPRDEANALGWFPRDDPRYQQQQREAKERGGNLSKGEGAGDPQIGVPYAIDVNAGWRVKWTGLLCKEPPYGGITAIDMRTGRTLWDRPFGTARKNGPWKIPSHLPLEIGTPNNGGSVVTAGGLIFIAAATDDLIRAIDIETGKTVWSDVLPAGGQANPMIYEQNGRQYLVIMAGGHHFMETPKGDYVIAYALPQR
ncbi:membrane-bound PQQ-dependent dehydrogenase, glucose/quinate/shikimate family [Brevundimonas sp. PAMC22021]|uniref:membrane-bound PQQ-dependent dehydrogenase, glucose/quinate/shikimate family n=1 Tax=Brevundimonas sp. PAMC22021 TaxID=2861285 RepID=UPI001C62ABE2|nr:membrane-bound PQQ-dependent dehydrogenase, glucose/quinate/shikimate family [Brevundimonas sp. PAMC22021]QYF87255.1 membrane-bound PQQ-dependent dehydrogenase, glucose/quinate/shikimate family [Brevundimonas sp. PAMC22021]